jgi:hypothetical protein
MWQATDNARVTMVREHFLQQENTFYSKRTHSAAREHILQQENTFYRNRTYSTRHVDRHHGRTFSKVLSILAFDSKCARTLSFEKYLAGLRVGLADVGRTLLRTFFLPVLSKP